MFGSVVGGVECGDGVVGVAGFRGVMVTKNIAAQDRIGGLSEDGRGLMRQHQEPPGLTRTSSAQPDRRG